MKVYGIVYILDNNAKLKTLLLKVSTILTASIFTNVNILICSAAVFMFKIEFSNANFMSTYGEYFSNLKYKSYVFTLAKLSKLGHFMSTYGINFVCKSLIFGKRYVNL